MANLQTYFPKTGKVHAEGRYIKHLGVTAPKCCASAGAVSRFHYVIPTDLAVDCARCLNLISKEKTMAEDKGYWKRHMAGMYSYYRAGKILAHIQRQGAWYHISVSPLGQHERKIDIPRSQRTLAAAKEAAKREYTAASRNAIKEDQAALEHLKYIDML